MSWQDVLVLGEVVVVWQCLLLMLLERLAPRRIHLDPEVQPHQRGPDRGRGQEISDGRPDLNPAASADTSPRPPFNEKSRAK